MVRLTKNEREELLQRIEEGMTTEEDADTVRDILDQLIELWAHWTQCVEAIDG